MLQIIIAIENQRKAVMAVGFSRRGQANSTVLIVDTKPLKDTRQTAHITRGCKYSILPPLRSYLEISVALLLGTTPLL